MAAAEKKKGGEKKRDARKNAAFESAVTNSRARLLGLEGPSLRCPYQKRRKTTTNGKGGTGN